MSDADRLFAAVVIVVAVYVFRVWDAKRRKTQFIMVAHSACVELARTAMENGCGPLAESFIAQIVNVEKGMGIRE